MSFWEILLQHFHLQIFTQTYLDIPVALLLNFWTRNSYNCMEINVVRTVTKFVSKTLLRFNFCATQCYSATLECMPVLPEIGVAVSFLQLDLSLALSCFLNKNSSSPLLFSQQDCCCFHFFLASHQKASWPLTKISSTPRMDAPICLNQPHEGRWGIF